MYLCICINTNISKKDRCVNLKGAGCIVAVELCECFATLGWSYARLTGVLIHMQFPLVRCSLMEAYYA